MRISDWSSDVRSSDLDASREKNCPQAHGVPNGRFRIIAEVMDILALHDRGARPLSVRPSILVTLSLRAGSRDLGKLRSGMHEHAGMWRYHARPPEILANGR